METNSLPMFRAGPKLAKAIEGVELRSILEAYAQNPFPLEPVVTKDIRHVSTTVSSEAYNIIKQQADDAGISLGEAQRQILETMIGVK